MSAAAGPLRGRLVAAFALVAVPPTLLLAALLVEATSAHLEEEALQRLQRRLHAARGRVEWLRQRAAAQAAAVLHDDLPGLSQAPDTKLAEPWLASRLAARRDLPVLELLDTSEHVLSSAHFPAGLGLLDRDTTLAGEAGLRFERVGEDYGVGERLAVVATTRGTWRGAALVVRAGFFLDDGWLRELGGVMQADVALRDERRERWLAPPESMLAGWSAPPLTGAVAGPVALRQTPYRWAAERLAPGLTLVAAEPRDESRVLLLGVRRAALGGLALALGGALAAAFWLAGRLAQPVSALAAGARRIADGDLDALVPVVGPREIAALAHDFNRMSDALRSSRTRLVQAERVASWREMARRLAHELKNPLFPIQLSVETLRRELDRQPSGRGDEHAGRFATLFREASDTILQELRSLRRIIDGFSAFARMPAPQLAPVDVNALVRQVVALYAPGVEGVQIELNLAEPARLIADGALLERALGNLVKNALEAMPGGGHLTVSTRTAPEGVAIDVGDDGPGLDTEQRTRLFTPEYTTKPGGSGLGLAIVQGIVSDHGGRIEVRSTCGEGTVFSLMFPSAPALPPPDGVSDSGSASSKASD